MPLRATIVIDAEDKSSFFAALSMVADRSEQFDSEFDDNFEYQRFEATVNVRLRRNRQKNDEQTNT